MTTIDTGPFRDMAAMLRQRGGWNVNRLAYVKGEWQLGANKTPVNGTQWATRPDWLIYGWTKRWDGKVRDYRLGYVADRYEPPARTELGDLNVDEWEVWNKRRDPWSLAWTLPVFNQVNGEEAIYQTDTKGGRDCLAILLRAFADRVDSDPTDGKILPVVELDTDSYHLADRGEIKIPVFNIIGWITPPNKPRPALPTAEPPDALPPAKPQQVIEGPRKSLAQDLNDELGF